MRLTLLKANLEGRRRGPRRWFIGFVAVAIAATSLVASTSSSEAFCLTGEGSYYRAYEQSIYEQGGLTKLGVVRHEIRWCVATSSSGTKSIRKAEGTFALVQFDAEITLAVVPTPKPVKSGDTIVFPFYRVEQSDAGAAGSSIRKRPIGRMGDRDGKNPSSTDSAIPVIYYLKTDGTNTRSGWSPKIVVAID